MSEVVDFERFARRHTVQASGQVQPPEIFFDRREFNRILNLYGRMVAAGEWRDYSIGHNAESCSFAVFRRSADGPLYRIVKTPKLARKQGAYAILSMAGRIVKRGHDLETVLRYFEPSDLKLV